MASKISRRDFLKASATGAATVAGLTVVPSKVLGSAVGQTAPSDKVNVAGVGISGMGNGNLRAMARTGKANIVALCDVDWKRSQPVFDTYPTAKKYWDFRKMYDEMPNDIDAVLVATPDHTHALVSAQGIAMGKHMYTQKPLTHSVYESRLLTKLAAKHKVATQMGNQGSSGDGVAQICDWIWNGEIGEVTKVEAWTNRPIWPQGLDTPTKVDKVPKTLDWDLFIGPAKMRPFSMAYHPWNWRGWWDYGTGALGDMACHIMHPIFKALKLTYPTHVQGSSTQVKIDCAPNAQIATLVYPARDNMAKVAMPGVTVTWYDGGLMPPRPEGIPERPVAEGGGAYGGGRNRNVKSFGDGDGGVMFHGTKDTLICGCYGRNPWLLSGREPVAPALARKVPDQAHEADWLRACMESPANRVLTNSDFSEAGPFNEMVVMGVLAVRLQSLGKILEWDGETMRFTNIRPDEMMKVMTADNFTIVDGDPKFDKKYTEPFSALEFANELIKHNYREPWKLPDMPL
jgi:predicted dehydrogenase